MAEPKQKSLTVPPFLVRFVPQWQTPQWLEAERWRNVVKNQPIAMDARSAIVTDLVTTPWEVRAKNPAEQDKHQAAVDYYTDEVLNDAEILFDTKLEQVTGDLLDLPIGGNAELVRWQPGNDPLGFEPHPLGHVHRIVPVDGASLFPTYDPDFPMGQRIKGDPVRVVYFTPSEMMHMVIEARPELQRKGYGMPPPEKIYLAMVLLSRGDVYYANLLLDTPEAGVLDLMDMSKKTATEWVSTFRTLLQGVDPQKIGILYEHEKAANYIAFGRPPTEMMYDTTTLKYARVLVAAYGLSLVDVNLEPGGETLAGEIRKEQKARRTGYALAKEKWATYLNRLVLPPYLQFVWLEKSEEANVLKYRALLFASNAFKNLVSGRIMTAEDALEQLKQDNLVTVEANVPDEEPALPFPPMFLPGGGDQGQEDKVPPEEGGHGEMTGQEAGPVGRAETDAETGEDKKPVVAGDERVGSVPERSSLFGQLQSIMTNAFNHVSLAAGDSQILRLVKATTRKLFPAVEQAAHALNDHELHFWREQRLLMWFSEPSAFDDLVELANSVQCECLSCGAVVELKEGEHCNETPCPDCGGEMRRKDRPGVGKAASVLRADQSTLDLLDEMLLADQWWTMPEGLDEQLFYVLTEAFSEGAAWAGEEAMGYLYTEGLGPAPIGIGINFNLTNATTLSRLEQYSAQLVTRINDGTRYYLKRMLVSGVEEGLSSPGIAQMIRDGEDVEAVLREAGFTDKVIQRVKNEILGMGEYRTNSIVNTEIAKAETEGRVEQWQQMGLTKKRWVHTGSTGADCPCPVCSTNIEYGFVDIDYLFDSVFGDASIEGPPAHPTVCHCHIEFDERELVGNADNLNVWMGE
jgi:predicted RNA-binding Zn-ribbon protein involved in translation (DUF1610 family)